MSGFRTPEVPREQYVPWEHRLEDAIPIDHQVRHLDALLNSEAFATTFEEMESSYVLDRGKPPYHPRDLAALYLYGMLHGIRSSRQLEAACYCRLNVIWRPWTSGPSMATFPMPERTAKRPPPARPRSRLWRASKPVKN